MVAACHVVVRKLHNSFLAEASNLKYIPTVRIIIVSANKMLPKKRALSSATYTNPIKRTAIETKSALKVLGQTVH